MLFIQERLTIRIGKRFIQEWIRMRWTMNKIWWNFKNEWQRQSKSKNIQASDRLSWYWYIVGLEKGREVSMNGRCTNLGFSRCVRLLGQQRRPRCWAKQPRTMVTSVSSFFNSSSLRMSTSSDEGWYPWRYADDGCLFIINDDVSFGFY